MKTKTMKLPKELNLYTELCSRKKPDKILTPISGARCFLMEYYIEYNYRYELLKLLEIQDRDMEFGMFLAYKNALFFLGYSHSFLKEVRIETKMIAYKEFRRLNPKLRPIISDTQEDINQVKELEK